MKDERILASIQLQKVISEKNRLLRNHESVPARLEELESIIAEAKGQMDEAKKADKENRDLIRRSKKEITTGEEKLASLQAKLNQVKTTREYESRQKEITLQRSRLTELQEIIQKAEGEIAEFEAKASKAQDHYKEISASLADEIKSLEEESVRFDRELQAIEAQVREVRSKVPADILEPLERLFRLRGGVGIVSINDGNCGGCGIQVSPQTIQLAKRGLDLIQCDSCSSFLYWDDDLD